MGKTKHSGIFHLYNFVLPNKPQFEVTQLSIPFPIHNQTKFCNILSMNWVLKFRTKTRCTSHIYTCSQYQDTCYLSSWMLDSDKLQREKILRLSLIRFKLYKSNPMLPASFLLLMWFISSLHILRRTELSVRINATLTSLHINVEDIITLSSRNSHWQTILNPCIVSPAILTCWLYNFCKFSHGW